MPLELLQSCTTPLMCCDLNLPLNICHDSKGNYEIKKILFESLLEVICLWLLMWLENNFTCNSIHIWIFWMMVCKISPILFKPQWASYQIGQIVGAHAPGMPGTFSPPPWVSDTDMHHGTCVTHVPWCMPGSLTSGFLWSQRQGKTFPAFPAHAQPPDLRIW